MSLNTQEMQYCCGAQLVYNFTHRDMNEAAKDLQNHLKSRMYSQAGMTVAFLNDGQKLRFHDTMEANGFRLVVNGAHNAKHDSKIYMYVHVFRPEKSEPILFPAAEVDY